MPSATGITRIRPALALPPNVNPNYSDGNAHGPTLLLLLLPLLGLSGTTLGTQTKCSKQGVVPNKCGGGFLSLSLSLSFPKKTTGGYMSPVSSWPLIDPRFSKLREYVSDPAPTVLKTSQNSSTDLPWNASSVPVFFSFSEILKITYNLLFENLFIFKNLEPRVQ